MSKKNEWTLVIENIGGIRKPLELKIRQPLSIIMAPNAAGKTSVVRALQLLCRNGLNLEYVLNEYAESGRVELHNDEHFAAELLRVKGVGVQVNPERSRLMWATDEKPFHACFCVRDSELVRIIEDYELERLKDWFRDVSDAHYYETLISILNTLLGERMTERTRLETVLKVDVKDKELALARSERELVEVNNSLMDTSRNLEQLGYGNLVRERNRIEKEIDQLRSYVWSKKDERERKRRQEKELRDSLVGLERRIKSGYDELYYLQKELKVKEVAERDHKRRIQEIERTLRDPDRGIEASIERLERNLDFNERTLNDIRQRSEAKPCIPILETRIKELEEELDRKREEKHHLQEEKDVLSANLATIERLHERADAKKRDVGYDEKRMTEIRDKELPKVKDEIDRIDSEIATETARLEAKEAVLKKHIEKVSRLEGVSEELRSKIDELSKRKSELEKDILDIKRDLKTFLEAQAEYDRANRVIERLQGFLSHLQTRYKYIVEGARTELNRALKENFELLQYTGFDEISITPEYKLVVRRRAGRSPTELPTLSSSERLTIAITMMFVAKQAYAPDFPLFVIDEVKEPYDETRFKRVVNYIKGKVPCLIVTSLVPLKDKLGPEAITVSYSLRD